MPASTVLIFLHLVCLFVVVESDVKFPSKYNDSNILHLSLLSFIKTNSLLRLHVFIFASYYVNSTKKIH